MTYNRTLVGGLLTGILIVPLMAGQATARSTVDDGPPSTSREAVETTTTVEDRRPDAGSARVAAGTLDRPSIVAPGGDGGVRATALNGLVTTPGHDLEAVGLIPWTSTCAQPNQVPSAAPDLWYRNADAKRGSHSIGWDYEGTGNEAGPLVEITSPTTLTQVTGYVRSEAGNTTGHGVAFYFDNTVGFTNGYWAGVTVEYTAGAAGVWLSHNQSAVTYAWAFYNSSGQFVQSGPTATLPAFATSRGGNGRGAWVGFQWGCDGGLFYVDDMHVVTATQNVTVDFEGSPSVARLLYFHPSSETWRVTPQTLKIRAGQKVVLAGDAYGWGMPDGAGGFTTPDEWQWVIGDGIWLAKTYGSRQFKDLNYIGLFDETSFQYIVQRPVRATSYRFHSNGSIFFETDDSQTTNVKVVPRVSGKVVDRTLVVGKRVVVKGQLKPTLRGMPIKLQRKVGARWKTIGSTKTVRQGKYTVSARASSAGEWTLRVLYPKGRGLLADTTTKKTVRIVKPRKPAPPPPPDPPDPDEPDPVYVPPSAPVGSHRILAR